MAGLDGFRRFAARQVQTTASYDRRGEAAKQEAADLLHVPYASRQRRSHAQASSSP